jgi:DNA-directed RNA polymerase specialized sigma24 family protein
MGMLEEAWPLPGFCSLPVLESYDTVFKALLSMTQLQSEDLPDPLVFLPHLRDHAAAPELREQAWGSFVRWFYQAHFAPVLEQRTYRRLQGRGMLGQIAPGDVFSLYCLRVREKPGLLGVRTVPTRSWLSQGLEHVSRDLEKQVRRRKEVPHSEGLRSADALPSVAEYLSSPENVILLRELEQELHRELKRLEEESPHQHRAWTLGEAGVRYREISELLDTSVGNVKSLVKRARDTLRVRLQAYLGGKEGTS